jgi:hypothetical protein
MTTAAQTSPLTAIYQNANGEISDEQYRADERRFGNLNHTRQKQLMDEATRQLRHLGVSTERRDVIHLALELAEVAS